MDRRLLLSLVPLVLWATPARAGLYTDEMSKCLVSSTTTADKTALVRWIFANAALHPDVASIAAITSEQRASMNRAAGELLTRLVTVACRKQAREAMQFEGPASFQAAFQVLGQVAMGTLMSHGAVAQGFGEFKQFVDEKAIEALRTAKE